MSNRFHNKWHRHNHHTYEAFGEPDSSHDPIASPSDPFMGDFVIMGAISASAATSATAGYFYSDNTALCAIGGVNDNTYGLYAKGNSTEPGSIKIDEWGSTITPPDLTKPAIYADGNVHVKYALSAQKMWTTELYAASSVVEVTDMHLNEISGFRVEGSDTRLNVPETFDYNTEQGLTLDGVGITGSQWASFKGDIKTDRDLYASNSINIGQNAQNIPGVELHVLGDVLITGSLSADIIGDIGSVIVDDLKYRRVVFVGADNRLVDSANFTFITETNTLSVDGIIDIDNIKIDGNTISSTNTDGNIIIDPIGNTVHIDGDLTLQDDPPGTDPATRTLKIIGARNQGEPAYAKISFENHNSDDEVTRVGAIIETLQQPVVGRGTTLRVQTASGDNINEAMRIDHIGHVGINTLTPNERLTVAGGISGTGILHIDGEATLNTAIVENLTNQRIVFTNSSKQLIDSQSLTFLTETNTLSVDGAIDIDNIKIDGNTISSTNTDGNIIIDPNGTGHVGINALTPNERLTVVGGISGTGILHIDGGATLNTAIVENLTNQRIVFTDSSKQLIDSETFTFITETNTLSVDGAIDIDNIKIDDNTISSTNTDGNIIIDPNGTGNIQLDSDVKVGGYSLNSSFTETVQQGVSVVNISNANDYKSAFYNLTLINNDNIRASRVIVAWSDAGIQFNEVATVDVGSTSNIILSATKTNDIIELKSIVSSGIWTIRGSKELI